MSKMPRQKPGKSEQIVETPSDLMEALGNDFTFDLAALETNKKAPKYFGPDSPLGEDALVFDWPTVGLLWLNPPYAKIGPWVKKCHEHLAKLQKAGANINDCIIAVLVPAAVGAKWFRQWVVGSEFATIEILGSRPKFVGHEHTFPKDLVLISYSLVPGIPKWSYLDWKPKTVRKPRKKKNAQL